MSPVQINERHVSVPTSWLTTMLGGALIYGAGMIWQAATAYGRLGEVEAAVQRTDVYIAGRVATNDKRWDQVAQLRDQVIRVEEQNKLILETVRRLDGRR